MKKATKSIAVLKDGLKLSVLSALATLETRGGNRSFGGYYLYNGGGNCDWCPDHDCDDNTGAQNQEGC